MENTTQIIYIVPVLTVQFVMMTTIVTWATVKILNKLESLIVYNDMRRKINTYLK